MEGDVLSFIEEFPLGGNINAIASQIGGIASGVQNLMDGDLNAYVGAVDYLAKQALGISVLDFYMDPCFLTKLMGSIGAPDVNALGSRKLLVRLERHSGVSPGIRSTCKHTYTGVLTQRFTCQIINYSTSMFLDLGWMSTLRSGCLLLVWLSWSSQSSVSRRDLRLARRLDNKHYRHTVKYMSN